MKHMAIILWLAIQRIATVCRSAVFKNLVTAIVMLLGLLALSGVVNAATVTLATGGSAIPSNTAPGCSATGTWATLTGPAIAEANAGEIGLGTIVLSAPAGFEFNTAAAVTILLAGNGTASRNINGIANGSTVAVTSVTATAITFTVTQISTRTNTLTWQGIQIRPTAATPLASGNITKSGTSTITGVSAGANLGTLTEVVSTPACNPVNTYYPGTASVAAGATTITLGAASGAATPIAAGDLVLIMQMQDASIDATNTATYGDGVAGDPGSGATVRNSGLYEYAVVASFSAGTLTLTCGTMNAYTNADAVPVTSAQRRFQVIRVPVYASYTLGAITAQAWNGSTGGVLAFDVTGALTLNSATVNVDGMGFRGGAARGQTTGSGTYTDYRTPVTNLANGTKGEGIAGTSYYVFTAPSTSTNTGVDGYPNGSFARGAPGNAGGGGTDRNPSANDQNPGGGGGANGGSGGIGGIGWCPTFVTTAPYYGCGYAALVSAVNPNGSTGGFGGSAVAGIGPTRLTLGGGGGSGTTNNSTGTLGALSSSGAAGGGIIMIRAGSMTGSATFNANGSDGNSTIRNDGSGGGGAGGIVMINAGSGMGGVIINVKGGVGGSNLVPPGSTSTPHGPGGGGGGGYAITSTAPAGCNAAGGANGVTYNNGALFGAYGAQSGSTGSCVSTLSSAQIPGAGIGPVPTCSAVHHFLIGISAGSASTCTPKNITITAQNASNATVTSYTGTVNITTSPAHGDWAKVTAGGTLTAGVADSGAASYQFVAGDNGVATLALTNHHADNSLTVTVVDSSLPSTSSTSAAISFSDNAFVITNDPIQVAGRPQAMSVAMWRKDPSTGLCAISPYYTGAKNLKAWLILDVNDPGGAAPSIGALSLPNALPGANNLALTFTAGSANFNFGTTDVGKYVLNLRDDSRIFATGVDINGSSSTITTRPFALVVSAIKQGAVNNPANGGPGGAVFAKAGSSFQAMVGAYLWNSAADTNVAGGDGVPDAAATLANITGAGAAPSYRWPTALAAGVPYTPATSLDSPVGTGVAGTFSSAVLSGACPTGSPNCFTNGIATPTNLSYSEVGSFTLNGAASNFLNSSINLTALVFDNGGLRNGVVGRFIPDHFDTVVSGGMPCPTALTCPTTFNGFVYSGQPFTTNVTARNLAGAITRNYDNGLGFAKNVTLSAWDALGSSVTPNPSSGTLTGSAVSAAAFLLGTASTTTPAYALPNPYPSTTPSSPTDIYLRALDTDNVTSLRGVPANSVEGGIKIISGRILVPNAYGSELLKLPIGVTVQYWNGTRWVTSSTDTTALVAGNVGFTNCQKNLSTGGAPPNNCKPAVAVSAVTLVSNGVYSITLKAPGSGNNGSADLTLDPAAGWPAWLPSTTGRATFGIYKNRFIYLREMY